MDQIFRFHTESEELYKKLVKQVDQNWKVPLIGYHIYLKLKRLTPYLVETIYLISYKSLTEKHGLIAAIKGIRHGIVKSALKQKNKSKKTTCSEEVSKTLVL